MAAGGYRNNAGRSSQEFRKYDDALITTGGNCYLPTSGICYLSLPPFGTLLLVPVLR